MGYMGTGVAGRQGIAVEETGLRWDTRLYDGLLARRIAPETRGALIHAPETRGALIHALGEVGVEAEFLLVLVDALPGAARPTHADGEVFLQRLTASLSRLVEASATLEVATQGYLTALEASYPGVESGSRDDVWWPLFDGYTLRGEPLEARLRRCAFAWRHVVESRLPIHMEAILEQLALTLFALGSLPPAGIIPVSTLHGGLYALSSALHGDIVPRHILSDSGDPRYPGALASVARLRDLNASDGASLDSDIAWARAQYAAVSGARTSYGPALNTQQLRDVAGGDARLMAAQAAYEWGRIIGFLEYLRRG